MDFAVGLVPDRQVKVLGEFFFCTCENFFFRLVKITSGLVHPGWKIEFLCTLYLQGLQ